MASVSVSSSMLAIKPSSAWTASDVQHLHTLVQQRNRFVCMQLVTMVKEQYERVAAATASADVSVLHAARFMYLATLSCPTSGSVLAAGLFYPRACSKDGTDAMPHVYVELLCCNSTGTGIGRRLLHHIEQFVTDNADAISEGFFGASDAATTTTAASASAAAQDGGETTAAGDTPTQQLTETGAAPGQLRRSYSSLPVLLPEALSSSTAAGVSCHQTGPQVVSMAASGLHLTSSSSSISSLASVVSTTSSASTITTSTTDTTASSLSSTALAGLCDCGSGGDAAEAAGAGAGAYLNRQLPPTAAVAGQLQAQAGSTPTTTNNHNPEAQQLCRSCKLIQGIRLLSVQSAQGFYTKCGYGAPDSCSKEMYKPIIIRPTAAAATAVLPRTPAF